MWGNSVVSLSQPTRKAQNIVPVTVTQLLSCSEDNYIIEGVEAHMVTIVGIVRAVESSATKILLQLGDHTGTMEAISYVGSDGSDAPFIPVEGTYVRIVGGLRVQKEANGKYIVIYKVLPIADMNELTCHKLEVVHVQRKMKKYKEDELAKKASLELSYGMNNTFGSSIVGNFESVVSVATTSSGSGAMFGNVTITQLKVLNYIKERNAEDGISKEDVRLFFNFTPKEITTIIDYLSGEGHIYSTIDDDHYKLTEWSKKLKHSKH